MKYGDENVSRTAKNGIDCKIVPILTYGIRLGFLQSPPVRKCQSLVDPLLQLLVHSGSFMTCYTSSGPVGERRPTAKQTWQPHKREPCFMFPMGFFCFVIHGEQWWENAYQRAIPRLLNQGRLLWKGFHLFFAELEDFSPLRARANSTASHSHAFSWSAVAGMSVWKKVVSAVRGSKADLAKSMLTADKFSYRLVISATIVDLRGMWFTSNRVVITRIFTLLNRKYHFLFIKSIFIQAQTYGSLRDARKIAFDPVQKLLAVANANNQLKVYRFFPCVFAALFSYCYEIVAVFSFFSSFSARLDQLGYGGKVELVLEGVNLDEFVAIFFHPKVRTRLLC